MYRNSKQSLISWITKTQRNYQRFLQNNSKTMNKIVIFLLLETNSQLSDWTILDFTYFNYYNCFLAVKL